MSHRKYLNKRGENDLYDGDANETGQTIHIDLDFNANANDNNNNNIDHYDKKEKRLKCYKYFAQGAPTLILGILGISVSLYMLDKIHRDFDYKFLSSSSGSGGHVDFCASSNSTCDENSNDKDNEACECALSLKREREGLTNCGYHCGIITCPDFTTASKSESASASELCPLLCKCRRGRSAAVGIVLTTCILQIVLALSYFAAWFIDCFDKGMLLCLFLFTHLVFLFFSLIALVTSWSFNVGAIPQNLEMDNGQFMNHDGNSIGVLFMSWTWMNTILSGGCFGVVMYYICRSIFPLNPNSNLHK